MAGLGESCSHVGALLFFIEAAVKIRDSRTVTEQKAYWMLPSACKEIPYAEISNIDFTSPNTLKKKFDETLEHASETTPRTHLKRETTVVHPTEEKIKSFYHALSQCRSKPVILSIVPPYDEKFKPVSLTEKFPPLLTELYDPRNLEMHYAELLNHCKNIELKVTPEQQINVEMETRTQHQSKKWFNFRSGRITASKVHAVVHTNENMPSQSLIRSICYPESSNFKSAATTWGCCNEDTALNEYKNIMQDHHENFQVSKCGLFISVENPFMGASPDALVSCSCCGDGCVEIKCSFSHKDQFIYEAIEQNQTFCLRRQNNNIHLLKTHSYFYQVQTQMYICNRKYCDFFMWTNKDYHIERIVPDKHLLSSIIDKCQYIFRVAILPELVGKFFSRVKSATTENYSNEHNVYCYCKGNEPGELFPCSNKECKIKLFHLVCVQLKYKPKRKWLCPDCRKAKASSEVNEKMSLENAILECIDLPIQIIVLPDS